MALPVRRIVVVAALGVVGGAIAVVLAPHGLDRMVGNTNIEFYGRTVDQAGNAVEGVQIVADITGTKRFTNPLQPGRFRRQLITTTDSNGLFEFHFKYGTALQIVSTSKAGWRDSGHYQATALYPPEKLMSYPAGYYQMPNIRSKPIIIQMLPGN